MTLTERLGEAVRACFPGLYVVSHEPDDAIAEIARLCAAQRWTLATWDAERGLALAGAPRDVPLPEASDPLAALRALSSLSPPERTTLLVLRHLHRFLGSIEIVQAVETLIGRGKRDRLFVVALSPVLQLPAELERQFLVIEHELPDGPERDGLLEAAAGLTRLEAEGAFALALVRHGRLTPDPLWELKEQALVKSGLLRLHRGGESFAELGGLETIKSFCSRALRPGGGPGRPRARGVLLLGVSGSGKSAIARALGHETGRPTLVLDVGALKGSLVGETESRTRRALQLIDRMAPCVVLVDEVEKALAGVQASGVSDGGVTAGLFGTLLSWLNDHTGDAFVVCTANDVSALPPESSRAERFDGVFFLDLHGREAKDAIWRIHRARYAIDPSQPRPDDRDWTGAEIAACCRLAALLEVPLVEAARQVVPVAATAAESVDRLRRWASGRCLAADRPGLYRVESPSSGPRPGRRVHRDPAAN